MRSTVNPPASIDPTIQPSEPGAGIKFSIVTISFNAHGPLRRTIESVNAQTYANIEHIFIDGGSTDGSPALIRRLANREPHVTSEPDGGIAHAFNKGTRHARGNFVCYLNAGDTFASTEVLSRVAGVIARSSNSDPTIYYGDFISIDREVPRLHRASASLEDFAWGNPINHQAAFVPRQVALEHPYDQRLTLGMDYDLWLRVIDRVRFHKLEFPVSVFEMGGRSSAPAWEVHSLNIHRMLWHMNRGSRFDAADMVMIGARALRLKINWALRWILGERLSLAIRAAKSRRVGQRSGHATPRLA